VSAATANISKVRRPPAWQADLALVIVALLWGTTFVIVKRALNDISTLHFLAIRFAVASVCMLAMFARTFQSAGAGPVLAGMRGGAIAGIFLWLGYVLQTLGLKYTTAGKSGFLTGLYIVLVPVIGTVVYRRKPQKRELIGVCIATAGMAVLTLPSFDRQLRMNRGDALTLGCAVAFAFQILLLGYYSQRERYEAVALGQIAATALLSTVFLGFESSAIVWTRELIFAIALTGVFATAVAFALQTWAQQYTTANRTALIFALEPVFAFATAVAVGGEPVTVWAVCGGALILGGILAVELKPRAA